jgi:hypothetical protein
MTTGSTLIFETYVRPSVRDQSDLQSTRLNSTAVFVYSEALGFFPQRV